MKHQKIFKHSKDFVAYYPDVALILGGTKQAILLCHLIFLLDTERNPAKGIHKTQAELQLETGLSKVEQRTARKALVELGLMREHHARLEGCIYFKLDRQRIQEFYDESQERLIALKQSLAKDKQFPSHSKRSNSKGTWNSEVSLQKGQATEGEATMVTDHTDEFHIYRYDELYEQNEALENLF